MAIKNKPGLLVLAFVLFLGPVPVMAGSITSHQIKAAMLIKFTDFIAWPHDAFENSLNSFVIGILGDRELVHELMPLAGKRIQGKILNIVDLDRCDNLPLRLHILYVGASGINRWRSLPGKLYEINVLTVSDNLLFLDQGGIMLFVEKSGNRLGFTLNRPAQIKSGLRFSASLLRLARIMDVGKEDGQ